MIYKHKQHGFILPVVIILSVALSIVGVTAFRTVSNSSVTLNNQYYQQLAREAAQAGMTRATSCIKQGTTTWSTPLKPDTDCSGTVGSGLAYVSKDANWKSTFEVLTPTTAGNKVTVTVLGTVTLTMADGTPIGQTITKNLRALVTVTAGSSTPASSHGAGTLHSCAVASGQAFCWGSRSTYGRLGDGVTGSASYSSVPVAVSTSGVLAGKTVTSVSAGELHACAVASGQAFCWGGNTYGKLGNNSTSASSVPVAVSTSGVLGGKTVTSISASVGDADNDGSHTCAVASSQAFCWGSNTYGRLGNNSTSSSSVPVAVSTSGVLNGKTVTSISAGALHTCAVASGQAFCWGHNTYGKLGNDSTSSSSVPVAVSTSGVLAGKTVTSISAGAAHTCAVADGQAFCWGQNTYGKLGNNSTSASDVPVAVSTSGVLAGKTVTSISAGDAHTCAVASGQAFCWGSRSTYGRLGDGVAGSASYSAVPVAVDTSGVMSGKTVTSISAGELHTCAVASGQAFCWGSRSTYGRLGDGVVGSASYSAVPIAVDTSGVLSGKTVTDGSSATPATYDVLLY